MAEHIYASFVQAFFNVWSLFCLYVLTIICIVYTVNLIYNKINLEKRLKFFNLFHSFFFIFNHFSFFHIYIIILFFWFFHIYIIIFFFFSIFYYFIFNFYLWISVCNNISVNFYIFIIISI